MTCVESRAAQSSLLHLPLTLRTVPELHPTAPFTGLFLPCPLGALRCFADERTLKQDILEVAFRGGLGNA